MDCSISENSLAMLKPPELPAESQGRQALFKDALILLCFSLMPMKDTDFEKHHWVLRSRSNYLLHYSVTAPLNVG